MILALPSGRRPGADAPPAPPRYATDDSDNEIDLFRSIDLFLVSS